MEKKYNIDRQVVCGFGDEWQRFPQDKLDQAEKQRIFNAYFKIFPWELLNAGKSVGADIGCGSGRWATLAASKARLLYLIDASEKALDVARINLKNFSNVEFKNVSADSLPFEDNTLDFAYSLGVLHHVPDTEGAVRSVSRKLKPGAPFLIYLYYNFDNRNVWYRRLWKLSESARRIISGLPFALRSFLCEIIALTVYLPVARIGRFFSRLGIKTDSWPLAYYQNTSFYLMRTCALDRFGTGLEKRFSREQIRHMLERSGFTDIQFSDSPPYWCAVGIKETDDSAGT
ncbi:MAG: class I SAM-dependent methyltransferase [Desulfobacteraceae bacterium]|nr:class I SAM-dependent methyltransferase [Desulfobacteraceae bacterium]